MTDRIPISDHPMDIVRAFIFHARETHHDIYVRRCEQKVGPASYLIGCLQCPSDSQGAHRILSEAEVIETCGGIPAEHDAVNALQQAIAVIVRNMPGGPPTAWARILRDDD